MGSLAYVLVTIAFLLQRTHAWQEWTAPAPPNGSTAIVNPGSRDGHTMVLYKESTLLLFGGRSRELIVPHIPKTFEVKKINGTLQFLTYDQKLVYDCVDMTEEECYYIMVGRFNNDLWSYSLDCNRGWDTACDYTSMVNSPLHNTSGWVHLQPGAMYGGCVVVKEVEICTHPHERFGHMSAVFNDGAFFIYGGYSRMCEDYCNDMWMLNVSKCLADTTVECKWRALGKLGKEPPGKRWRAATTYDATRWVIFGGFRLWHGFSPANSLDNRWRNLDKFEYGGFLDDMWVFEYKEGMNMNEVQDSKSIGWKQVLPKEACYSSPPTPKYEDRFDVVCTLKWPSARSSAALTFSNGTLFLHGGYSVPFPYPHLLGRGSGPGVSLLSTDSQAPYASYPYYLDDLWRFDFGMGIWHQIKPIFVAPRPRFGHTLVTAGAILLMHGGFVDGNFLDETWLYNIKSNRWKLKTSFVYPVYPAECTSDVWLNETSGDEIVFNASVYGEPTRDTTLDGNHGRSTLRVLVPQPRRRAPGWDGCRHRADGRTDLPEGLMWKQPLQRAWHAAVYSNKHSAMVMYGGESTLREEAFSLEISAATQTVGDFWTFNLSHCVANCSLHGKCIYGHCKCDAGWYGLDCSNATCPGDICTYDPATFDTHCNHCLSMPYVPWTHELLVDPTVNKADAYRLVFSKELQAGGAYGPEVLPPDMYHVFSRKVPANWTSLSISEARTRWLFDEYEGGVNISVSAAQEALQRVTHGVCDGFGQCQCAPPFLGDDCSILDCLNSCSGHGWCSVEYPVSRCMCEPPWTGIDCSRLTCPNNCSYPNGECIDALCKCGFSLNPYNRSQNFMQYGGDDCSYQMPFAGAHTAHSMSVLSMLVAAGISLLMVIGG